MLIADSVKTLPKIIEQSMKNAILERLGAVLGPSWGRLGASWGRLWPSWGVLGASWVCLGGVWGRLGGVLGRLELDFHGIPSWIPFYTQFVTDLA